MLHNNSSLLRKADIHLIDFYLEILHTHMYIYIYTWILCFCSSSPSNGQVKLLTVKYQKFKTVHYQMFIYISELIQSPRLHVARHRFVRICYITNMWPGNLQRDKKQLDITFFFFFFNLHGFIVAFINLFNFGQVKRRLRFVLTSCLVKGSGLLRIGETNEFNSICWKIQAVI